MSKRVTASVHHKGSPFGLVLPSANMGVVQHLGSWWDKDRKNGMELFVLDEHVVMHNWVNGEKVFTVQCKPERAEQMAELLYQGAQRIKRAGGSVAIPMITPEKREI